jgi:hypothetical protein
MYVEKASVLFNQFGPMQYIISQFKIEKMEKLSWNYMQKIARTTGSLENAQLFSLSNNFNLF